MPTLPREIIRTIALDAPFVDAAIFLWDIHFDPAVRIRPLKVFNHSDQSHLLISIEHRERVVRKRRAGTQHEKRTQERDKSPLHDSPPKHKPHQSEYLCDPLPPPA